MKTNPSQLINKQLTKKYEIRSKPKEKQRNTSEEHINPIQANQTNKKTLEQTQT